MPFPLHKAASGLLELFRLRTLGAQPNQFGEQVVPMTDVTDFYGATNMVINNATGAAAAIGTGATLANATSPRRIVGLSGSVTMGAAAGTSLTLRLGYETPPNSAPDRVHVAVENLRGGLVAGQLYGVAWSGSPFVLPAGHSLFLNVTGDAAGADHIASLRVAFQRLDGTD